VSGRQRTPTGPPSPPAATYRVQVTPDTPFDAVAQRVGYLADLGVSHLYLSPLLQAAPGSTHGYDVIDHAAVWAELGGEEALRRLAVAAHARGLGLVADIVPNHMALAVPEHRNAAVWSVLRDGPASPYAPWFDVDWGAGGFVLPILNEDLAVAVEDGTLVADPDGPDGLPVVRYGPHEMPLRPGTHTAPLEVALGRQHYRLTSWRDGDAELNWRRFFTITSLVGLRVEDERVFDATHALLLRLVAEGVLDGLRVDHPDGLADPRRYLDRLAERTGGVWVVVEKVLEPGEDLPGDWACDGTTGYETAFHLGQLAVHPAGAARLATAFAAATGSPDWPEVSRQARREVLASGLRAEVHRLARLGADVRPTHEPTGRVTADELAEALVELLAEVPVYRVYVDPVTGPTAADTAALEGAAARAGARRPDLAAALARARDLALGRGSGPGAAEYVVRFGQTSGPSMAKGVEDRALFRWFPLVGLADVGADPSAFGGDDAGFHAWAAQRAHRWPHALTATSTHDSKRSEDVRARLAVLSEVPEEWLATASAWTTRFGPVLRSDGAPDPVTTWLAWQSVVGAWPLDATRLAAYLVKATREAGVATTWADPDAAFEDGLAAWASRVAGQPDARVAVQAFVDRLHPGTAAAVLGQRALALALPGVPDIYQGCESLSLRLTDPDNRVPVDTAALDAVAAAAQGADVDPVADLAAAKLALTRAGLWLRRERPALATAGAPYEPLVAIGPAADHLVGMRRGDMVASVTRWALRLPAGGLAATVLRLPAGVWRDALTGQRHTSDGGLDAAVVHARWPATFLVAENG